MSILSKLLNVVTSEDRDYSAIRKAIKIYTDYKKHEAEASEEERKEAEKALAFLKLNDNDPT